jgi:hypothetical protein
MEQPIDNWAEGRLHERSNQYLYSPSVSNAHAGALPNGTSDVVASVTKVRFRAQDALALDSLRELPREVTFGLRKFPHARRYHEWVSDQVAQGNPVGFARLCALAQRDWHIRGQTGCQFARLAALAAHALSWHYLVAAVAEPIAAEFGVITSQLELAERDQGCEILSILFPAVTSPRQAVNIIYDFATQRGFWLERVSLDEDHLRLHLRYTLPGPKSAAWIMAFAPFDFMPNSRRSPYFELAIRVKPKPSEIFHRINSDRAVAHLADAPLTMPAKHWEDRWQSTLKRTRMILGHEPNQISAAKATLTVPRSDLSGYTRVHDFGE